ncbi:MAG: DNA cytosine methyltransferase [Anaerolineae bacterium]
MAFEEAGFCVVRGPDLLWGGDIKKFHPPSGRFDGVIGGPPCKAFSSLAPIVRQRYGPQAVKANLIPEFERCIAECQPRWFVMENVRRAPLPQIEGYAISALLLNARHVGSEQMRVRRFSFGIRGAKPISLLPFVECVALEPFKVEPTVLGGHAGSGTGLKFSGTPNSVGKLYKKSESAIARMNLVAKRTLDDCVRLQGLPPDFLNGSPLTLAGKRDVVGQGVPLPMGRAIANAVRQALQKM